MCGYCTEGVAINYAVSVADGTASELSFDGVEVDDLTATVYLIESEDFISLFLSMAQNKGTGFLVGPSKWIAFFRLIEDFMRSGYEFEKYHTVSKHLPPQVWRGFFIEFEKYTESKSWLLMLRPESLGSEYGWNDFIESKGLLNKSIETLDFYYEWWISGKTEIDADESKRREKFNAIFPFVLISFLYFSKQDPGSEIIKKIALEPPKDIPAFEAFDLWLQRQTFVFCVREYGIQFIFENYQRLRAELIAYALLKVYIDSVGLNTLMEFFSNNKLEPQILADSDYLLEIVNDLLEAAD